MASKPVRFHPQAEEEYLRSLVWYRDRSQVAAVNFESAFAQAISKIGDAPQRWPIYFDSFRKYILRQFPFGIIYQDFPSQVMVFAVAHGHRRPGYWMTRI
jgi:plasmid stabilization system protein ParE